MRVALLLCLAGCTVDTPAEPPPRRMCQPADAMLTAARPLSARPFVPPAGCLALDDDQRMAVQRRTYTIVRAERELQAACGWLQLDDAGAGDAGERPASGIDFTKEQLVIVRVPDSVAPQWIVEHDGVVTVAENTVSCRGTSPTAIRYGLLLPAEDQVEFFSCDAIGCEEDE